VETLGVIGIWLAIFVIGALLLKAGERLQAWRLRRRRSEEPPSRGSESASARSELSGASEPAGITFRCYLCSEEAGYFGVAEPGQRQSLSSSLPTIVRWGPEGGLEQVQTAGRSGARALAALAAPDPARALYDIHPPWVTAFCPGCEVSYCNKHWLIHGGGADGHGRKECRCPKGHTREIPCD
jgi:hypothetical protein